MIEKQSLWFVHCVFRSTIEFIDCRQQQKFSSFFFFVNEWMCMRERKKTIESRVESRLSFFLSKDSFFF